MTYLDGSIEAALIALFVGYWIFWLVDFINHLFFKFFGLIDKEIDRDPDVNVFFGESLDPAFSTKNNKKA